MDFMLYASMGSEIYYRANPFLEETWKRTITGNILDLQLVMGIRSAESMDCKMLNNGQTACFLIVDDVSVATFKLRLSKESNKIEAFEVIFHFMPSESFDFKPHLTEEYLIVDSMAINKSKP